MKISGRRIHFFKHAMCIRSRSRRGERSYYQSFQRSWLVRLFIWIYELYNKNQSPKMLLLNISGYLQEHSYVAFVLGWPWNIFIHCRPVDDYMYAFFQSLWANDVGKPITISSQCTRFSTSLQKLLPLGTSSQRLQGKWFARCGTCHLVLFPLSPVRQVMSVVLSFWRLV